MKKVAIYCVDQDGATTRSLGIYNYTRRLIHALAKLRSPGLLVELWLTDANAPDLAPPDMPEWMSVRRVRGSYGTGLRRLFADHILAPRLTRRSGVDLVHYPKGWIPAVVPHRSRVVATMHDAIVQYYLEHSPSPMSTFHLRYFDRAARHTLARAHLVLTPSAFSAGQLSHLVPESTPRIRVVPEGGPILWQVSIEPAERRGFLVIGSKLPHKATSETLHLLRIYREIGDCREPITVVGLPDSPAPHTEQMSDMSFLGTVSDEELTALMRSSRALVFLSHVEGFGLPALEAYAANTPVCYRNSTALAEILAGTPGAWDGQSEESFVQAMDAVLRLTPQNVRQISENLANRHSWTACAESTIQAYRDTLAS